MSQDHVERVIGRLATDEGFRQRFADDRDAAFLELAQAGFVLTGCELRALANLDQRALEGFAAEIDPRIQKSDLRGDCP